MFRVSLPGDQVLVSVLASADGSANLGRTLSGIAVATALLGVPALAADLEPMAPPIRRPVPAVPATSWSGPYIGTGVTPGSMLSTAI